MMIQSRKQSVYSTFIILIIIALSAGCNETELKTTQAVPTHSVLPSVDSISAISPISPVSPISDPTFISTPVPTPESGKGTVLGQLLLLPDKKPSFGSVVYLAPVVSRIAGSPTIILDEAIHPKSITTATGDFFFPDVTPGEYGVIVWTPLESILLDDPTTRHTLIVNVINGEIIDLKTLETPIQ